VPLVIGLSNSKPFWSNPMSTDTHTVTTATKGDIVATALALGKFYWDSITEDTYEDAVKTMLIVLEAIKKARELNEENYAKEKEAGKTNPAIRSTT
jgi:uncharacterized lipoprotein YehR (DUF1307 family)